MGAGEYCDLFEWLSRSMTSPDAVGEKDRAYASAGTLWGALGSVTASTEEYMQSGRAVRRGTIKLRNYPAVAAGDRLRDVQWDETWHVEAASRGDNERLCEVVWPPPSSR